MLLLLCILLEYAPTRLLVLRVLCPGPPRTGRATQMSASSDQSSSSLATSLRRQDFILSSRKALSRPIYGRINIHTLRLRKWRDPSRVGLIMLLERNADYVVSKRQRHCTILRLGKLLTLRLDTNLFKCSSSRMMLNRRQETNM